MSEYLEVSMGKYSLSASPNVLTTSGVGSCMAVCLYDRSTQKGSLAHVMLPRHPAPPQTPLEDDFKYADIAIAVMVSELEKVGVKRSSLTAKIVGGANMFPGIAGRSEKPGEKNIHAVKEVLEALNIPVAADSTGGTNGRSLSFDLSNGIVAIKITI